MNEHIEVVKKWLADNDSVSKKELRANRASANRARSAVYGTPVRPDGDLPKAEAAFTAACSTTSTADFPFPSPAAAAWWVKQYEELENGR